MRVIHVAPCVDLDLPYASAKLRCDSHFILSEPHIHSDLIASTRYCMCFENGMQFFESLQGICQQAIELKLMIERNSILRPTVIGCK